MPFDPRKPFDPSGIRLGTPAVSSRGMKQAEMKKIGSWIDTILRAADDEAVAQRVAAEVRDMCESFPAPGISGH